MKLVKRVTSRFSYNLKGKNFNIFVWDSGGVFEIDFGRHCDFSPVRIESRGGRRSIFWRLNNCLFAFI